MRIQRGLIFVAAAAVVSSVLAADKTWTGNTNTAWATTGNWNPTGAPATTSPYSFIIIPGSRTNYPVLSAANATIAGLQMDVGSQLTISSGRTLLVKSNETRNTLNGAITVSGTNSILDLDVGQLVWTNSGTISFVGGGNFKATNDGYTAALTLTNTGGTIQADANSAVMTPVSTIVGGTLDGAWWARSTTGSAWHSGTWSPHWLSFTNVTLGSSFSALSTLVDTYPSTHIGQANLFLTGSVTNNSTVLNYPAYGSIALEPLAATSTFTFNGTGSLGLQGQTLTGAGVSTIANNGSHTLKGYGTLGGASTSVTNAGTIKATGGTSGTPRTLSATAITNTGSIVVDPYSTLSVSGALLSDTGSTVTMSGGTISAGTFTLNGALSGDGTIGNVTNSGSILATGGTVGSTKTLYTGTITGAGTVTVDQYNSLSATGTVAASSVQVYGELHTDNSNWTVNTLDNIGTVHVETGKSLTSAGAISSAADSILMVNGTLTAPSLSMAGTLSGSGTINSIVTLTGTVSPGNSPGTLTMDGLIVGNGAEYSFDPNDMLAVNGALEFQQDAVMTVHVPAGLTSGMFYPFMTYDSIVGTASFTLEGADGYVVQQGTTFGFQVPEPAILGMAGVICLVALVRRPVKKAEIIAEQYQV